MKRGVRVTYIFFNTYGDSEKVWELICGSILDGFFQLNIILFSCKQGVVYVLNSCQAQSPAYCAASAGIHCHQVFNCESLLDKMLSNRCNIW